MDNKEQEQTQANTIKQPTLYWHDYETQTQRH